MSIETTEENKIEQARNLLSMYNEGNSDDSGDVVVNYSTNANTQGTSITTQQGKVEYDANSPISRDDILFL